MIATLEGIVGEKLGETIVLDVRGVGYGVLVSAEDYGSLQVGERTKVYIHEHIRESSHDLFGFCNLDAKNLFEQLLNVNGVGPKMALSILSVGSTSDVRVAIAGGDTKFIQRAGGVGKRVAERVIVELKDTVGLDGVDLGTTGMLTAEGLLIKDEAVEALVSLGFTPQDAASVLSKIDKDKPIEERVRLALKAGA